MQSIRCCRPRMRHRCSGRWPPAREPLFRPAGRRIKPRSQSFFSFPCPLSSSRNCFQERYHRLARADTPASVSFRRFLPFSPWRAPARLRLKNQKSLVNSSLAGALQFCRSRNVPRQGKTCRGYCRILKGLDAVWGHFCPSKPWLPLSIDGTETAQNRSACNRTARKTVFLYLTAWSIKREKGRFK